MNRFSQKYRNFFLLALGAIGVWFVFINVPQDIGAFIPFEDFFNFTPKDPEFIGPGEDAGTSQLVGIILRVVDFLRYAAGLIATIWISYQGVLMIASGNNEDQVKKSREGILYGIIALVLIVIIEPLITDTLYGGRTINPGEILKNRATIEAAIGEGKSQILALVDRIKAISVFLAIAYIVFSAVKLFRFSGAEEEISKQKTVLIWIGVGFLVMIFHQIIVDEVVYRAVLGEGQEGLRVQFSQNPARGIAEIGGILLYLFEFLAAIAIGILVYGGFLMVTSYADEEGTEKGKKIITNAGIGFLIILISYILVKSVVTGTIL